jgi:23S rRNA-/tRNA-specific pseudouridylate synthase
MMLSDHDIKCYCAFCPRVAILLVRVFDDELMTAVNRLDRLTSGLMILALTTKAARDLSQEFMDKTIRKEYVARVKGKFPE